MTNAIQTRYAGHHFRSRLEARWAVFFDKLAIAWQYESQGYHVGPPGATEPYLPDFRLPDLGVWVEVKGQPDERDLRVMVNASRRPEDGGLPGNRNRALSLIILGDVPNPQAGEIALHNALIPIDDDLLHAGVGWTVPAEGPVGFLSFVGPNRPQLWMLQDPMTLNWGRRDWPQVHDAYTSARQARFEHGASG